MELFASGDQMKDRLRQAALDIITPFMGQNLPFITVQQVIEGLRSQQMGITINRGLLLDLLNPDEVEGIAKIEGDRIYLANSEGDQEQMKQKDEADAEKDAAHVVDMAQQGAKKASEPTDVGDQAQQGAKKSMQAPAKPQASPQR